MSDIQLQDDQMKDNDNNDKESVIESLVEASKIHLNMIQKYDGGLTAFEAMDLINKYNEALASIDY